MAISPLDVKRQSILWRYVIHISFVLIVLQSTSHIMFCLTSVDLLYFLVEIQQFSRRPLPEWGTFYVIERFLS